MLSQLKNQADKIDGFEIKCRVMDPQNGAGNFVVKADGPQKYGSMPHHGLKVLVSKLSKSNFNWRRICWESEKAWLSSWLDK